MEIYKELDIGGKQNLLEVLNDWWVNENMPEEALRARIVLIFKKGDTSKLASNLDTHKSDLAKPSGAQLHHCPTEQLIKGDI